MSGFSGIRAGLRGTWAERIYCKLKYRGCCPDTITADGKADCNFAGFTLFSAKGLQNRTFENFGVVTAESSVNTAFFKELTRVK